MVAFLLDAEIRSATDGKKSLDDVMRMLYERHAGDTGYTPDDFRVIVDEVSGADLSDWFAHHIEGIAELDYSKALDWYGLQFQTPNSQEAGSSEEKASPVSDSQTPEASKKAWVGVTAEETSGRFVITKVLRDAPAFKAGLNPDDEILAIDGYRVTAKQWESRLKQYRPGDSVDVLIARREHIETIRIVLGEEPANTWKLSVLDEPSEAQKQRLSDWLHQK